MGKSSFNSIRVHAPWNHPDIGDAVDQHHLGFVDLYELLNFAVFGGISVQDVKPVLQLYQPV